MKQNKPYSFHLMLTDNLPYGIRDNAASVYYYCDSGDAADSTQFTKLRTLLDSAAGSARKNIVRLADIIISEEQKQYIAPWLATSDDTWTIGDDFFSRFRISDEKCGPLLIGFNGHEKIFRDNNYWYPAIALKLDWNLKKNAFFRQVRDFCRYISCDEAWKNISGIDDKNLSEKTHAHYSKKSLEAHIHKSLSFAEETIIDNDELEICDKHMDCEPQAVYNRSSCGNAAFPPTHFLSKFIDDNSVITTADKTFDEDTQALLDEVRKHIEELNRKTHLSLDTIMALISQNVELSEIVVDNCGNVSLPLYNTDINLAPMPRAVYLLFLKHPEGIRFKELADYQEDLENIYAHIKQSSLTEEEKNKIALISDPTCNNINVQCSRIKNALLVKFNDNIARHYYIDGMRGMAKSIKAAANVKVTLPKWLMD